jgi:Raf kinase inhibitor-like YbhB/YbcL family protein
MVFTLISPAFADNERIPRKHARDGENIAPALRWTGAPEKAQSFALIVEDPDAPGGTFLHWAVFHVPGDHSELPESVDTAPGWGMLDHVVNDFGNARYDGPQPPHGHGVHHYHFRLFALDVPKLAVPVQAGIDSLKQELRKHQIGQAELVGLYEL